MKHVAVGPHGLQSAFKSGRVRTSSLLQGYGWDSVRRCAELMCLPSTQAKLEELSGSSFDSCLLNMYRDGGDNMGEHRQW